MTRLDTTILKDQINQELLLQTPGPLVVSAVNPRYFTVASSADADKKDANRKIVYLTGSHINNNFQDGISLGKECDETTEAFDFSAYLNFLKEHGHNFIRLWRWEQFKGY